METSCNFLIVHPKTPIGTGYLTFTTTFSAEKESASIIPAFVQSPFSVIVLKRGLKQRLDQENRLPDVRRNIRYSQKRTTCT